MVGATIAAEIFYVGFFDKKTDFTARAEIRSPLIDGFESYASAAEVMTKLSNEGHRFTMRERGSKTSQGMRPPFHTVTLTVSNYTSLKEEGMLELYFFNDRLHEIIFYPENIDQYWNQLASDKETKIEIPPYTRVEKYSEASGTLESGVPKRIRFVDDRLQKEQSKWIMKYS